MSFYSRKKRGKLSKGPNSHELHEHRMLLCLRARVWGGTYLSTTTSRRFLPPSPSADGWFLVLLPPPFLPILFDALSTGFSPLLQKGITSPNHVAMRKKTKPKKTRAIMLCRSMLRSSPPFPTSLLFHRSASLPSRSHHAAGKSFKTRLGAGKKALMGKSKATFSSAPPFSCSQS